MAVARGWKLSGIFAASLAAYLLVAAAWAWWSFDTALAGAPATVRQPLSARQVAILLRVEDPSFFDHAGVSLADGQGAATITSALARELYLDGHDFGGARGLLQAWYRRVFDCCRRIDLGRDAMALVLDARLPKDKQLALYVARVYMGTHERRQVRGLAAAAQAYLGKPLGRLTDAQFIQLAAMIRGPNRYHPVREPAAHAARAARVAALVAGRCRAGGWFDTSLERCGP